MENKVYFAPFDATEIGVLDTNDPTQISTLVLGGGGGSGGFYDTQGFTGPAGNGGGIIHITAGAFNVTDDFAIKANGDKATIVNSSNGIYKGGSGGGAGGSIYLEADTRPRADIAETQGGPGSDGYINSLNTNTTQRGGDGGLGRVKLTKTDDFSKLSLQLYNGASTSQDILTLTDDQYSEIPANIMKNWGADDFELTLEIKTTDGTDDIAADGPSGILFTRNSQSGALSTGPTVTLDDDGAIKFRLHSHPPLELPAGTVSSWADWVHLKFALETSANASTMTIYRKDGSADWGSPIGSQDLQATVDVSAFNHVPLRIGASQTNSSLENLNATIRNLTYWQPSLQLDNDLLPKLQLGRGAAITNDTLTLDSGGYAILPASVMNQWGTNDFALSISIKTANTNDQISGDPNRNDAMLFHRTDFHHPHSPGPRAYLYDNGNIEFHLSKDLKLTCPDAIADWTNWNNLHFERNDKTITIKVNDGAPVESTCTKTFGDEIQSITDTFTALPLTFNSTYRAEDNFQGLIAKIRQLEIPAITSTAEETLANSTQTSTVISGVENEAIVLSPIEDTFELQLQTANGTKYWEIPTIGDGFFHHVALVRDGDTNRAELFFDGESKGAHDPLVLDASVVPNARILFGHNLAATIDNLHIYGDVLNSTEIREDMHGNLSSPTLSVEGLPVTSPNLLGMWSFDDASGGSARDLSNHARDGILGTGELPSHPTWSNQTVRAGETLYFDATESYDSGIFDTLTYFWGVKSNNGQRITPSNEPTFSFTPSFSGLYNVTATVTDKDGLSKTLKTTISIDPIAKLYRQTKLRKSVGDVITYDANDSSPLPPPEFTHGSDQSVTRHFAWKVTRENSQNIIDTTQESPCNGSCPKPTVVLEVDPSPNETFAFVPEEPGLYTTTLTLIDIFENSRTNEIQQLTNKTSHTLTVASSIPTVRMLQPSNSDLSSLSPAEGDVMIFGIDTPIVLPPHGATGRLLDTSRAYQWEVNGQSLPTARTETFEFTAPDDGHYTVKVTVTDRIGLDDAGDPFGSSDFTIVNSNEVTFTAREVAPKIAISGPTTIAEGSLYPLTLGEVTDPGDDQVSQVVIHWGDNSSDNYKVVIDGDGNRNWTRTYDITDATSDAPIKITSTGHGLEIGDTIKISGVEGNTAANGTWTVSWVDADNFRLDEDAAGNAEYDGGGNWTRLNDITGATNPASGPIQITSLAHGLIDGNNVAISDVVGNTNANGWWTITRVDDDHFTLDNSTGNATYNSGGNWTKFHTLLPGTVTHRYLDDSTDRRLITVDLVSDQINFTDTSEAESLQVPEVQILRIQNANGGNFQLQIGADERLKTEPILFHANPAIMVNNLKEALNSFSGYTTKVSGNGNDRWRIQFTEPAGTDVSEIQIISDNLTGSAHKTEISTLSDGSTGVEITNVVPTIILSGAAEINEDGTYSLTLGEVFDPGNDTITQYIVDWGDGSAPAHYDTTVSTVDHTYDDGDAQPLIKISLIDEDGIHNNVTRRASLVYDGTAGVVLSGNATFTLVGNGGENTIQRLTLSADHSNDFALQIGDNDGLTTGNIVFSGDPVRMGAYLEQALNELDGITVNVTANGSNSWDIEFTTPARTNVDLLTSAQGATESPTPTIFTSVETPGSHVNEIQTLTLENVIGGSFRLRVGENNTRITAEISCNVSPSAIGDNIEKALNAIPGIKVSVTQSDDTHYQIEFIEPTGTDVAQLQIRENNLVGDSMDIQLEMETNGIGGTNERQTLWLRDPIAWGGFKLRIGNINEIQTLAISPNHSGDFALRIGELTTNDIAFSPDSELMRVHIETALNRLSGYRVDVKGDGIQPWEIEFTEPASTDVDLLQIVTNGSLGNTSTLATDVKTPGNANLSKTTDTITFPDLSSLTLTEKMTQLRGEIQTALNKLHGFVVEVSGSGDQITPYQIEFTTPAQQVNLDGFANRRQHLDCQRDDDPTGRNQQRQGRRQHNTNSLV